METWTQLKSVIFTTDIFAVLHLPSITGHCMHLIFKIGQILAGTAMINQFHGFFPASPRAANGRRPLAAPASVAIFVTDWARGLAGIIVYFLRR